MNTSPRLIAILVTIVTALTLAATDIYLPATLVIAKEFGTTNGAVQATISLYFLLFAIGQLIAGPLSDRYGRRKVLIVSQVIFLVATAACAFATTIEMLIATRLIQALGACAGNVLARAIVKDVFEKDKAIKVMTSMGMAMAIAPALAPPLGFMVYSLAGWRSIFLVLSGLASLVLLAILTRLPETFKEHGQQTMSLPRLFRDYRSLLGSADYMKYASSAALLNSGLFAIIISSPFVFMDQYGMSQGLYSGVYSFHVFMFVTGAGIASALSKKLGADKLIGFGVTAAAINGLFLFALCSMSLPPLMLLLPGTLMFSMALGFVFPSANISAIMVRPKIAGTASALLSFLFYGVGAMIGIGIGELGRGGTSPLPMILTIGTVSLLSALTYFGLKRASETSSINLAVAME